MKKPFQIKLPQKVTSFIRTFAAMNIPLYAANAGFFVVLAVFPMLVLILSLLRYTGLDTNVLTDVLEGVIPSALLGAASRLIQNTYANTSGTVISISAIVSLWSASRGIYGILTGLNAIYGVEEHRGYLHTRFISVVFTFAFLIVILLTLTLHVFGTTILGMIPTTASSVLSFLDRVIHLRFFLLVFTQTLLFTAVFTIFPNRRNSVRSSLPGALLTSLGWLIFSGIYSVYVERFASLTNVYGSVYTVALSMLWLYCCLYIMFCGGALNRSFMTKPRK
jgi:membrane protein